MMKKKFTPLILIIVALISGGILMTMEGKDAVTMAATNKNSLLTADTINTSFQGVGGKVTAIQITEEQQVKQGDILMTLDSTDFDFQIAKLKSDIEQQNVKIEQAKVQGNHTEEVERQVLAVEAAQQTLNLAQTNYNRVKELFDAGAETKVNLDTVSHQLATAKNTLSQQQATLKKIRTDIENNSYNVELQARLKESMTVQLQSLEVQRDRMVLKAPADGKVTRIVPKLGENIAPGAPAVAIETNQLYYNIYVDETQISKYKVNGSVSGHIIALKKDITGKVRHITSAPQYASMRMSRDKGQADISSFLVRIDVPCTPELLPGMTVEVGTGENIN